MSGCYALIVAAGRGRRFGAERPKQYAELAGVPVLRHALAAFAGHPEVAGVLAVIHPDDTGLYAAAAEGLDLLAAVPGGDERQQSVALGLDALTPFAPDRVLIHDGARPFASPALISRVIAALEGADGALPVLPVTDTLKRVEHGRVAATVDRASLARAQTPQGFRFEAIRAAHASHAGQAMTDDAALAEAAGLAVAAVDGDPGNVKITTQDDLDAAARELAGLPPEYRTGSGFDVHRFGPGDHVTLCGVEIPHDRGLVGHSDADAGLHAITDALLGAIAAGDIGDHFPPSEPQWKGAPSRIFLAHAARLLAERGGKVVNVDLTLICERPKIGPHREAMAASVAEILGIEAARVGIKATTTERLGFTGRGEGLAAQAVVTVALSGG